MNTSLRAKVATVGNLLTGTAVFTEVLRAYPWLMFLSVLSLPGWTRPPLDLLSSLVIVGLTAYLVRASVSRAMHFAEIRQAVLGIEILLMLLLIRLENGGGYALWDAAWFHYAEGHAYALVAGLAFGFFLLWRGIIVGREEPKTSYLYRNFVIGIVGFIFLMIIWSGVARASGSENLFTTLVPYVLGYFFAALMGLGVSNFMSLREGTGSRGKATDLFARRWLMVLLSVVLLIVIVGLVVASGLSFNLAKLILDPMNKAAGWLATGFLYGLGYVLGFIVEGISIVVTWFYSLIPMAKPKQPPQIANNGPPNLGKTLPVEHMPVGFLLIVKWVIFAAVIALIIYFLWRALRRYWKGSQDKGYDEINESLWGSFSTDMKSLLKGLMDRFRRKPGAHAAPPLAVTMTNAEQFVSVRELYKGLLWVGAETGHPKATAETPFEYRNTLRRAIAREASLREGLADLTDAYVQERYGHVTTDREKGMALVRLWLRLRSALRGTQDSSRNPKL